MSDRALRRLRAETICAPLRNLRGSLRSIPTHWPRLHSSGLHSALSSASVPPICCRPSCCKRQPRSPWPAHSPAVSPAAFETCPAILRNGLSPAECAQSQATPSSYRAACVLFHQDMAVLAPDNPPSTAPL